ncbi:hypothetical protein E3N88_24938 [Mikania micrantha]|uniref:Uncharacterized protein n=1 Tax=Mikania micrantha TaxID=192012 RepID=A0A5N6N4Z7_9ASTR|nr:hypothetical protein E3N88_24938 [Mikania micrantha]
MPTTSRSKSQSNYTSNHHDDDKKSGVSGEKRKTDANGNVSGEFSMPAKRLREVIHGWSGRWNADDEDDESEIVNIDDDDDFNGLESNDLLTAVGDLKNRKHNVRASRGLVSIICDYLCIQDLDIWGDEFRLLFLVRKQLTSYRLPTFVSLGDARGAQQFQNLNTEWPIKEETRNIELEKELEKRMKRREGYSDKCFKHKDKVYKYSEKDNKHKVETNRKREDGYNKNSYTDYKHKEDRYWDEVEQDHRHKTGQARVDINRKKRSRDHTSELESKNLKDGRQRLTDYHKSLIYDDQVTRHKDDKDARRDDNNNKNKKEVWDYRSSNVQGHDAKIDPNFDCKYYPSRGHHRVSKQETKYKDGVHEETAHHNLNSKKDLSDKVCIDYFSPKKRLKSDSQLSLPSTNELSSHLPPQSPFKAVSENLLRFGSSEDGRSMLNNHNWKWVDSNLGITRINWNSFLSWPYTPFHHIPPMFNPFMYQSMPPIPGGPPMNMNHVTLPYQFTGDGYGNWGHGRTELNDQSWDSNVAGVDLQAAAQQNGDSVHGHTDEIWSRQTDPHVENEESNLDFNIPQVMKVTESSHVSMVEKDDDTLICRAYLSKIDVSKDLTRPELYDMCTSMLSDFDQASSVPYECDCRILFLKEGLEDDTIFAVVDDSVYKKAMSLYTKQKVCFNAAGSLSVKNQEKERCAPSVDDSEEKIEVKVKDYCNNHDARLCLTDVSTSDLIECGSLNFSRIHSPETTH